MKKMFQVSTKTIVATGLGAALFTLLFMYVKVPTGIPETSIQTAYGLGAFFAVLFLAVAVLILYFKQVSEGYEDKARFEILQKVGMDDQQVKQTINAQVLWVFFLPLAATALHMLFASKIMALMLQTFMLYDWGLVLTCIGGTLLAFTLLYFGIYRITAQTYYRIVRR